MVVGYMYKCKDILNSVVFVEGIKANIKANRFVYLYSTISRKTIFIIYHLCRVQANVIVIEIVGNKLQFPSTTKLRYVCVDITKLEQYNGAVETQQNLVNAFIQHYTSHRSFIKYVYVTMAVITLCRKVVNLSWEYNSAYSEGRDLTTFNTTRIAYNLGMLQCMCALT